MFLEAIQEKELIEGAINICSGLKEWNTLKAEGSHVAFGMENICRGKRETKGERNWFIAEAVGPEPNSVFEGDWRS